MYAIVDIETTGGHAGAGSITEIAVILHNGQEEEGRFHTLVNPLIPIPRYVQSLTGITDAMVASAPHFDEVAEQLSHVLKGRIFVAHNVNFDYSFIRHQLAESGLPFDERKLCTIRLSRKIFPNEPRYSLGNLCRSLGIPISNRHRAMGDAEATVQLFRKLLESDREGAVKAMLKQGSREAYLPLNLEASAIDGLPEEPGVYYFHDGKDKVIYVGKAVNIRKRVTSHFSNNSISRRKQEMMRQVHRISYERCGTEFMASVWESIEIKRLWPAYNHSQKKWEFGFGLCTYEDRNNILRIGIERQRRNIRPLHTFNLLMEGHALIRDMVREFSLCPKYCFLQTSDDPCAGISEGYCHGVCEGREQKEEYNIRVRAALDSLRSRLPSFAILENGRREGEKACVLVDEGRFHGLAYIPDNVELVSRQQARDLVTPYPENGFLRSLVLRHGSLNPARRVDLA
jgi:DNA polymerase-3 subunit epsilon